MRLPGGVLALLAAASAVARIDPDPPREPRALTGGELRSLKTALLPFVRSEHLDLSSLATQGWRGRLEASLWGPASTTPTGLCTARQRTFQASPGGGDWAPVDSSGNEPYVWLAGASGCKRPVDPVHVNGEIDPARVAAIVRGDNRLHDRLAALAVATCGPPPQAWRVAEILPPDGADAHDQRADRYPHVGVMVAHRSGKYVVEMSVRFGPNGPEPWNNTGCPMT